MQRSKDMRCSHKALFNHLVGELLQIERHLEAKHLGGREMMTRSNFVAMDRQVARPLTLENAGGVDAYLMNRDDPGRRGSRRRSSAIAAGGTPRPRGAQSQ
jgi:hypothetical protein